MFSKESTFKLKRSRMGRYRWAAIIAMTAVTGCYLWVELGALLEDYALLHHDLLHWGFAGTIWVFSLAGIQYGFRRIGNTADELAAERNNLIAIFEAAQVGMLLIDDRVRVVRVNETMQKKFETAPDSHADSRHGIILRCPNARANPMGCGHSPQCNSCGLMGSLREALTEGTHTDGKESLLQCEYDGELIEIWVLYSVRPLEIHGRRHALMSLLDVTERRAFQQRLLDMAFFDPLTRLPNRTQFNDRLNQLIADSVRNDKTEASGILFLDLDGFKAVNDTLGHEAGDRLLQESGERIRGCLRDYDMVARLGGDEFAVILPEVRHDVDLAVVARKILAAIEAPFYISGKELFISTSIGIACYPSDSSEPAELIRNADAAMYHAKASGRNNFQFYSESMTVEASDRMELEADLRKALLMGELEVYYQPKVDTIIGLLVGAEALLRWHHPTRGLLTPDRFVGIAEDTGLITGIGTWVLQTACRAAQEWNHATHYPIKIAVNLSVRQFMAGNFVETVRSVLAETHCRPEWLELEITETLLMAHKPEIIRSLNELNRLGITIAIDDFGTGYSALSYLTQFPVSTIKIDKSFIQEITTQKKNLELVKAIVSMGLALGLELVAEGVETGEQAAALDRLGCHLIQGYFYGRPMPAAMFCDWRAEFLSSRQSADEESSTLVQSSWRDYLTTGNEFIDAQHRELFKRITKLTLACRGGKGHDEVSQLLDYLGGYIRTHFSAEEELLISAGSPHYKEHKAAHDHFTAVIDTLRARYRECGETLALTIETNCVAVDWLTRHICTMDRELARLVNLAGNTGMEHHDHVCPDSAATCDVITG